MVTIETMTTKGKHDIRSLKLKPKYKHLQNMEKNHKGQCGFQSTSGSLNLLKQNHNNKKNTT
jgi:hypothetical protein